MSTRVVILFSVILVSSLSGNVYLYSKMSSFKDAWINQFITTGEIETILKASSGDFSLEAIHKVSTEKFGSENVHIVDLKNMETEVGADKLALGVNDTLIFFKDGIYYGSKSNLRNH